MFGKDLRLIFALDYAETKLVSEKAGPDSKFQATENDGTVSGNFAKWAVCRSGGSANDGMGNVLMSGENAGIHDLSLPTSPMQFFDENELME